jgi:hypothetical protein
MSESNDRHYSESEVARFLMEQGNCGYRPGQAYPRVSGSTERGQIWLATMGPPLEEHERHLAAEELKRPKGYTYKVKSKHKRRKIDRLEAMKYGKADVTFTDPDIFPRHMKGGEFVELYSAVAFANTLGVTFNVHLTIDWQLLGYQSDARAQSALSTLFIRHFDQWCRDKNIPGVWIYSNESSDRIGLHTHFLAAIDRSMLPDFQQYVAKRMKKIDKLKEPVEGAYFVSIPRNKNAEDLRGQWRQFQYLCKGLDPFARLTHHNGEVVFAADLVSNAYESPGEVSCKKRCGLPRSLGKAARQAHGFLSEMERGQLNVDVLYPKSRDRSDMEICEGLDALSL